MNKQKTQGTPKFHQGDSSHHHGCRPPSATETTPTPADTAPGNNKNDQKVLLHPQEE